jgi:NADP-dependent 3-hydroxy acid dehydrogenase YdfG
MPNHHPLQARLAVVTGATAGIGLALVRELASLGAFCVINARRREKLDELARELGPEHVLPVAGDCADQAVIDRMLDTAKTSLGEPGRETDLVVINAGRGLKGSVLDSDQSQWQEVLRTNVEGAARLLRSAANRMLAEIGPRTGPGVLDRPRDIVVLGSTVGRHVSPFSSMYGATKFAVHGMVEAARRELGPKGVRLTLIEPGFVESEFQGVAGYDPAWFAQVKERIGPALAPVDVARAIVFIASQPAHVHINDVVIRPTRQDYP